VPKRALEILGQPSCTESIKSIDSEEGVYDPATDQCCYEVTTKTEHQCGVDGD
jgi:hypothetical protein